MRLVQYEISSKQHIGVRLPKGIAPVSRLAPDLPNDLPTLLALGPQALERIRRALESVADADLIAEAEVRLLPPITNAGKVICLGLNYEDHAAESNQKRPEFPVVFFRANTSLVAHHQPIIRPRQSTQLDFEAELVAVIGKTARHVSRGEALDYVAGYSAFNDGSIRDYQRLTPQWTIGKNFDGTGAFGPDFVTSDELPAGAKGLTIETKLNGQTMQSASTSDMIFDVAETIELLSACMTLEPGDVLVMGTPAGIGAARKPPVWMKPGDEVEVTIERIGTLSNRIVEEEDKARAA